MFNNVIYSKNKQRKFLNEKKTKYLNHSVCAICEQKLKYLDKDEKAIERSWSIYTNKGNNKISELRTIWQRERQNS
jgi:CRISPR/Cas system Type II protein with McrA/HNH and RuvC-like nuclease domain